jgi:hypothetical protein
MVNDKILDAVKINKVDYSAHLDYETEYWLNFQVTGTVGQILFVMGKGDEDRYICGAREFDNAEEVLDEIATIDHIQLGNLNNETAQQLANELAALQGKPEKAKLYMHKLFANRERINVYFKALIMRKLRKDHMHDIKKFMHEANDAARDAQKSWESTFDDF